MSTSNFSIKNPWMVSFLIPILSLTYGNFCMFIFTSLILLLSLYLSSKHANNVQLIIKNEVQQPHQEHNVVKSVKRVSFDMGSPDYCSESEVIDQFSSTSEEDSDFERWQFSGETRRSFDCSDGSISDEESLIEIALPGGHYVGYKDFKDDEKKEERKFSCRRRSPESVLWWPEMNEEENMIEIDISVGSIKCSRFNVKA